jgi:hypothetical protein
VAAGWTFSAFSLAVDRLLSKWQRRVNQEDVQLGLNQQPPAKRAGKDCRQKDHGNFAAKKLKNQPNLEPTTPDSPVKTKGATHLLTGLGRSGMVTVLRGE